MTLEQLADTLPNGFHDAEVEELVWNFRTSSATFTMQLWVAEETDQNPEVYRAARLQVRDIAFMAVDPPSVDGSEMLQLKPRYDDLTIDSNRAEEKWFPILPKIMQRLPAATEVYSFYVNDWNSWIHIASKEAKLTWLGEKTTRERLERPISR